MFTKRLQTGEHQMKVMLRLWWDRKSIVHYELLTENETVDDDRYCLQLGVFNKEIQCKCPSLTSKKALILHHDKAGSHAARKAALEICISTSIFS
ncbi:hypothetical protein TNCV_439921 [Trichonephila clavipes]|nr:hypothetical protein TNCV_439921 [Trichonephila clavipes]